MTTMLDAAAQTYKEEALELLNDVEEALLELESNPADMECVARAFRALHTIKGSGAMFGFTEIARFTHDVETAFDKVRCGALAVTKELLTLTLRAKDHIFALLQAGAEAGKLSGDSDALIAAFKQFLGPEDKNPLPLAPDPKPAAPDPEADHGEENEPQTFWIRYRPARDTFLTGTNPLGLVEELATMGVLRHIFYAQDIPALDKYAPDQAYGWWDLLLNTVQDENAVRDVFVFVEEEQGLSITKVGTGKIRGSDLDEHLPLLKREPNAPVAALTEKLSDSLRRQLQQISQARLAAKIPDQRGDKAQAADRGGPTSIRVDSIRLDKLVNMVGEMVIIQSRLTQAVRGMDDPILVQIAEDLDRLTDEMRDNALSLRMLPFGTTFSGLRRLVRDLTTSLNKGVEFLTEGADTELDKTVIDRLKDPLMHILRNAIDHGLESPSERKAAGKPEKGTISLSARHVSGEVHISVSDDGKGIDPEKVRAKGVERGLIAPDADLAEKDIFALLFEPGFSTAEQVSNVSGRGVGMDVVKKSIDALRGTVEIVSAKGKGATFTVRLPLTLAIIDGLQVRIGKESYIIPLSTVEACQERFLDTARPIKEIDVIERMGEMVPCISLRRLMQVPGKQPGYERIIIAGIEGAYVGLAVDVVVGRQQAVVKSLSDMYDNLTWISGATINGDGGISLILDVPQIVRFAGQHTDAAARR